MEGENLMRSSGKRVGAAGALGALCLLLWASPSDAGDPRGMPPEFRNLQQNIEKIRMLQNSSWSGSIEYIHQHEEDFTKSDEGKDPSVTKQCNERKVVRVAWDACFRPRGKGRLRATPEIEWNSLDLASFRNRRSVCTDSRGKGVEKSPGHRHLDEIRYQGAVDRTYKASSGGKLTFLPDGTYMLSVASEVGLKFGQIGRRESFDACTGKDAEAAPSRFEYEIRSYPISVSVVEKVAGEDSLAGTEALESVTGKQACASCPGDQCRTTTVLKWNLRRVEPCGKVRDQAAKTQKIIECYRNPAFIAAARDTDQYESFVNKCIGAPPPGGGKGYEVVLEGGVDRETCELNAPSGEGGKLEVVTFDEFRDHLKQGDYLCEPDVVVESIVQHERKHMEQCHKWGPRFSGATPRDLSSAEVQAYCREAGILLDFLTDNCGGAPKDTANRIRGMCK
jgi:hypothetical protein